MTEKIKTRMTGKDYRKYYNEIKNNLNTLNDHLGRRLYDLCLIHPDISKGLYEDLYNCIIHDCTFIKNVPIETKIKFITEIEKESAKLEKVKQMKLKI